MRASRSVYWNAYPALLCAGAVATGILGGALLSFWGGVVLAGTALLGAGGTLLWKSPRLVSARPLGWTLAVLLALAALGGARLQQEQALPPAHLGHLMAGSLPGEEPEVVLEGRIREPPRRGRKGTRFRLSANRLFAASDTTRADTVEVTGAVEVALRPSAWEAPEGAFPPVVEGDLVRLRGALRTPPRQRNPAGFDYGDYLRRRGVYATMDVYEPANVTVTGRRRSVLEHLMVPARHYVERQLVQHVPGRAKDSQARAVLRALLLGSRNLLTGETEERFVRSGLMHLLAVSGLHVLLVGWLFYQVLRPLLLRLGLRRRGAEVLRAGLTLSVLAFYVLLAGAPASAVRAGVMAALLMGATLAQRPSRSLNALGAAAVVLLLWRPVQLFEAGFQLSFAAVGAIIALGPVLQRLRPSFWEKGPLRRWSADATLTTLAATLGTLPVLLAHFGRVPLAGLLLNLWALPLTAVALLGALAAVALGAVPGLANAAGTTADLAARGMLWTARAGEHYGAWTVLRMPSVSPWLLGASVTFLLVLAAWRCPRLRWRMTILTVALVTGGCWQAVLQKSSAPRLDALFFDVGHGDAVLLSTADGRRILVDAGGRSPVSNAARTTLLPHLERYGIDRLDALVLSHPDGDHLGGVPALLRHIEVGRFISGGDSSETALYAETRRLLDSLHVPVRIARAGDTLHFGAYTRAQVLAPTKHLLENASENNASLVFQLRYGTTRWLFTGDAEAKTEALLVESYGSLLQSEVVKVGHHSSATSSTPAFVRASGTKGTVALASSGHRFGLPDRSILARWEQAGARPLATADEGALWLRSDGERVWRVCWRCVLLRTVPGGAPSARATSTGESAWHGSRHTRQPAPCHDPPSSTGR